MKTKIKRDRGFLGRREEPRRILAVGVWLLLFSAALAHAGMSVKIVQLNGEVKVRRDVEEKWEPAAVGMLLKESDTIMTLEAGEAVLELESGARFRLSGNAILDVFDLREITERELFLALMAQKIGRLEPRSEKIQLRIGEVSSPRSTKIDNDSTRAPSRAATQAWRMELNAARALRTQSFLTNAALKLHRAQEKFPQREDCGEVSFELAQAFETLRQTGRARDAYQAAAAQCEEQSCSEAAAKARWAAITAALQRLQ